MISSKVGKAKARELGKSLEQGQEIFEGEEMTCLRA